MISRPHRVATPFSPRALRRAGNQDVVAGLPKLASVSKLTKQTQAARAQDPVRQWIESMQWEDELVAGLEKARQERRAAPNGRVSVPSPSPGV